MRRLIFSLIAVLVAVPVQAQLYDDGGVHTINTTLNVPNGIAATNATTLNLDSGAAITGNVTAYDGSTLNIMPGSSITALPQSQAINIEVHSGTGRGSNLNISGGEVRGNIDVQTGCSVSISGGTFTGSSVLTTMFPMSFSISGGTFTGDWPVSVALDSSVHGLISGGTFTHVDHSDDPSSPQGPAFYASLRNSSVLDITGGHFNGDIFLTVTDNAAVNFFGRNLNYSGGMLTGVLNDGSPIASRITFNPDLPLATVYRDISFVNPAAVPAPPSLILTATGLIGLAIRRFFI